MTTEQTHGSRLRPNDRTENTQTENVENKTGAKLKRRKPVQCSAGVRPITFKNKFGIIGASAELSDADVRKIIKGPIAAAEPALQAELKKPAVISAEDWPNDKLRDAAQ
jgi:hypothetical protein